ncbi:hypothetical protein L0664_02170 [Octadecabacter sp. G9-8]|uniref:Peptidoglycan binding-like domain-containing protein n=1 Tax=Octadecabacter dasysiphoniae TaxID=2909341 RepID=A0ABS9CRP1_9RHOB|nr:hypothetical protein [Octadecabacter dasysiphoniae]MCF2869863.1 hypothetical protein [Octadecabacter dasysiphoniae]
MRFAGLAICLLGASATPALAAPCVSDTFDVPLPGATDVVSHVTDVPSSQFPGFWQEGQLDGYQYKIFANATATLRGGPSDSDWSIELICDLSAKTCAVTEIGTPPANAPQVARRLEQCFVPSPEINADAAQPTGEPPTDVGVAETTFDQQAPTENPLEGAVQETCGVALVDEQSDVAIMQRLLIMVGSDPGVVDGFLGPATFEAMDDHVENSGWDTSIPDLISQLDRLHCSGS